MDVDEETARWAQVEDSNVVWCDSAEALLAAVEAGSNEIEVGLADAEQVLDALSTVAPVLRSLSLTNCGFDAPGLARLGAIVQNTQLWGFGVSNNAGLDSSVWAELWEKLPTTLEKYDFGDNGLTDEALPKLMAAVCRGQVEELLLDGNALSDISPLLPCISREAGLTELDIGDNNIQDDSVLAIAQLLPESLVSTLVLGRNSITDASAVPLCRVLPQSKIAILHLDSTQIGDSTLDALVGVLANAPLEELHVDETKVTDAGVLRLCRALPNSRISLLDAGDNNLSEETAAAVEAALAGDDDTRVE